MKLTKKVILFIVVAIICSTNRPVYADSLLNCKNTLRYNWRGTQVKNLQRELNQTMGCNLAVDGIFGSKTYQCVTSFQKKYGLVVDGIVGKKTCSKLNSLVEAKNNSTSTNNGGTTNSTASGNYLVVSANRLNVRKGATTDSKILDVITNGSVYQYYSTKTVKGTTWYRIKVDGKYGYVCGKYIRKDAIVLDISEQNLKLYKNGKQVMSAPVVTGDMGNHDTPTGHYVLEVKNKQKARTLRGYNDDGSKYASYVDYWMPFITSRGIGFHDADWREASEFNTSTYKTSGSHGCVNMQKKDAKALYNAITKDTDVFVVA